MFELNLLFCETHLAILSQADDHPLELEGKGADKKAKQENDSAG
jgi:hypothetical protein